MAKRIVNKQDNSQADPSAPQNTTELVQITLQNVDIADGKQIQESIVPNAKVFMGTTNTTKGPIKVPTISFIVPDKKFAKWLKNQPFCFYNFRYHIVFPLNFNFFYNFVF